MRPVCICLANPGNPWINEAFEKMNDRIVSWSILLYFWGVSWNAGYRRIADYLIYLSMIACVIRIPLLTYAVV